MARHSISRRPLLDGADPCFGLDVSAVAEIRTRIMAARKAGASLSGPPRG